MTAPEAEVKKAIDKARADAIGECVEVAKSHKHVSACDGIGCKQVIAAALEQTQGREGGGGG